MAIKPIESYDDDMFEEPSTNRHMFKTIFLMVVILMGAAFAYFSFVNKVDIDKRMVRTGIKPTPSVSPISAFETRKRNNEEVEDVLVELKNESAKVLDSSMKQATTFGGNVLGDATEQVQNTSSSSAQAITNLVYKNTIGKVILQLFNSLPEEAKKGIVVDICGETKECDVK